MPPRVNRHRLHVGFHRVGHRPRDRDAARPALHRQPLQHKPSEQVGTRCSPSLLRREEVPCTHACSQRWRARDVVFGPKAGMLALISCLQSTLRTILPAVMLLMGIGGCACASTCGVHRPSAFSAWGWCVLPLDGHRRISGFLCACRRRPDVCVDQHVKVGSRGGKCNDCTQRRSAHHRQPHDSERGVYELPRWRLLITSHPHGAATSAFLRVLPSLRHPRRMQMCS